MGEDIKILEDTLQKYCYKNCKGEIDDSCKECKRLKAIENLLTRYKQLEEENKQLKEYIVKAPNLDEMTAVQYTKIQEEAYIMGRAKEQQRAKEIIHNDYIPKSKVKEKIEELENESYQISLKSEVAFDSGIMKNNLRIKVLQELLEEK